MAEPRRVERPLSPFMIGPYYRPQLNSIASILTRLTGNGLVVAAVLAVWWLLAAAIGDGYFAIADRVVRSWFGKLVFLGSLWAMWYHYFFGLRHLYFDAGKGLDMATADRLAIAGIAGSVAMTVLTLLIV